MEKSNTRMYVESALIAAAALWFLIGTVVSGLWLPAILLTVALPEVLEQRRDGVGPFTRLGGGS